MVAYRSRFSLPMPTIRTLLIKLVILTSLVVALVGTSLHPVHAAAIVVDSTDDTGTDTTHCTLRAAINTANGDGDGYGVCQAGAGADTITFSVGGTITLTAPLTITSPISISGTGQTVILDGDKKFQVFIVQTIGGLALDNLTIQNAYRGYDGSGQDRGGAIYNHGTLAVTNSTITGSYSYQGGGIFGDSGSTTTVTGSTFTNNRSDLGAAIHNTIGGTLIVRHSTFSGNQAWNGAIFNEGAANIDASIVSGNTAGGPGGGIDNTTGTMTITNSTISGNSVTEVDGVGGGIGNAAGTMIITDSTISGNSATNGGGISTMGTLTITSSTIAGNTGGGIYIRPPDAPTLYLTGTILQTGSSGSNCGTRGTIVDNGYNLSSDASCHFGTAGTSVDNALLDLSPLAYNDGGSTQTQQPGSASWSIGAIPSGTVVHNNGVTLACDGTTTDQNNIARPRTGGIACTSGAAEFPSPLLNCPMPGSITTFADLTACLVRANLVAGTNDLTLGADIVLTKPLPFVNRTVTLHGGGHALNGNNAFTVLTVSSTGNLALDRITARNGAAGYGAALVNSGVLTITNSTIASNAGGIATKGTLTITSSTLAENSGGISFTAPGTLYLAGTLLQSSGCGTGGTIVDNGYNLSSDASCHFGTAGTSVDNALLDLSPLADNGSTQTQQPGSASWAIGAIPSGTIVHNNGVTLACNGTTADQNNIPRPRTGGLACTSGAVEPSDTLLNCPTPDSITTFADLSACLVRANLVASSSDLTLGADITLTKPLPMVNATVALHGAGHALDGSHTFNVLTVSSAGSLALDAITVGNGAANLGGGIANFGTLTLANGTISGNVASTGGGGLMNAGKALTVTNTTFSNNTENGNWGGGAIFNFGPMTITGSTFTGNHGNFGGAIDNEDSNPNDVSITGSTFSNNSTIYDGGAIENWRGALTLNSCLFSNNSASSLAGGIINVEGTLTITKTTFKANTATWDGGALENYTDNGSPANTTITASTFYGNSAGESGGGIMSYGGTVTLVSSTLSKNVAVYGNNVFLYSGAQMTMAGDVAANGNFDQYGGDLWDQGYNLADDVTFPFTAPTSKNNVPILLQDPTNNDGGTAPTMKPYPTSPVIGAVPNGTAQYVNGVTLACDGSATDQNGITRPRVAGEACTSGAVEVSVSQQVEVMAPNSTRIANGGSYDMGSTPFGTALTVPIHVLNNGASPLSLLTDAPAVSAGFAASHFSGMLVPGEESVSFDLTCNATTAGTMTGSVSFYSTDSHQSPFHFSVTCTVLAPDLRVVAPDGAYLLNGSTYSMGTTTSGNSLTRMLTVQNTGTLPLNLLSDPPAVTGKVAAGHFGATTLPSGSSTTFDLSCDASQPGTSITGTVSFDNDVPGKTPFHFTAACQVLSTDFPAPDTLVAAASSQTGIDLSWANHTVDETAIRLERSPDGASAWTEIGSVGIGVTSYSDTKLDCTTPYYYRVRAYRSQDGAYSNYSNVAHDTTQTCLLAAPTLSAPANGSLTNNNTPAFTWTAVTGADAYQIQIDDRTDFASPAQDTSASGLSYTAQKLVDGTTYAWRVRALGNNGSESSSWSDVWTVQIDRAGLAAPTLATPANLAIVPVLTPSFTWTAVTGATQYQWQYDLDPTFGNPLRTRIVSKSPYVATAGDGLQYGMTCYWRVRAGDANGQWGAWSSARAFTLTILKTPADGAYSLLTDNPFAWYAVPGATGYRFQLAQNSTFMPQPLVNIAVSGLSTTVKGMSTGIYYWRVQAVINGGAATTPWMPAWMLTVTKPIPLAPVLQAPPTGSVSKDPPQLAWLATTTTSDGPFDYQIQIDTLSSFLGPVRDVRQAGTAGLNYYTPAGLPRGTFSWRVRAINARNTAGLWSGSRTFLIDTPPPAPVLSAPADWSVVKPGNITFSWKSASGAKQYVIDVVSGDQCDIPGFTSASLSTLTYTAQNLGSGVYCWHVRGIDAIGGAGAYSAFFHLTVSSATTTPPPAPVLGLPADKAVLGAPATFTWSDPSGIATRFQVQIDSASTFPNPKLDTVITAATVTSTVPAGKYSWRVRGINGDGAAGPWSVVRSFTLVTAILGAPNPLTPPQLSSVSVVRPKVTWQAVAGAKAYRVQLGTDPNNLDSGLVDQSPTTTSYALTQDLGYGTTYYWHVQTINAANVGGAWSPTFQFTVTVHLTPANGSPTTLIRPTFTWAKVSGASYTLELATNSAFTQNKVTYNPGTAVKFTLPAGDQGLTVGKTYYWHVHVVVPGTIDAWMPAWKLVVTASIPGAPTLLSPATNSLTGDNTPTFTWTAVTGGQTYQIQIDDVTTFPGPTQDAVVEPGAVSYTADMLPNGKYFWRVRAINGDGAAGVWSAAWNVTVNAQGPDVPVPTGPADGTYITNPMLTLHWAAAARAATYEVRLGTTNLPNTPPIPVGAALLYKPTTSLAQGQYFWQVRAVDAAGNKSAWSTVRSFNVIAGYTQPNSIPATPTPTITPPTPASLCTRVTELPVSECAALSSLYESTRGDAWTKAANWLANQTPCSSPWYGITCSGGHVVKLDLSNDNLAGPLPATLTDLMALEQLNLSSNKLSGPIPALPASLLYLDVSSNQLSGPIPALPTRLWYLDVSVNHLTGMIPASLANTSIPLPPPPNLKLCGDGNALTSSDPAVNRFIAARVFGWTGRCSARVQPAAATPTPVLGATPGGPQAAPTFIPPNH